MKTALTFAALIGTRDLSLASIGVRPIDVEGFHEADLGGEGQAIELVLPEITFEVAREALDDYHGEGDPRFVRGPEEDADEYEARIIQAFEEDADVSDQWRDGFFPMMNVMWPVHLAYGVDARDAAARISALAGATALVDYGGDYEEHLAIVLTGGGMDLSDHLARAYLCCGCVPPLELLENSEVTRFAKASADWRPIFAEAMERADGWLAARRERIASHRAEIIAG